MKVSFANTIYDMMSTLLGVDARTLPKEVPMVELGGKTLRYALQTLGTEWGRTILFDGIWVEKTRRLIREIVGAGYDVVIDDLRFINEEAMLQEEGAKLILIDREGHDSGNTDGHASEGSYLHFHNDRTIINACSSSDEFVAEAKEELYSYL